MQVINSSVCVAENELTVSIDLTAAVLVVVATIAVAVASHV